MSYDAKVVARLVGACLLAVALTVALLIGIWAVVKVVGRAQKRADANNRVQVTHILIRNAQQQARIVRAQNERVRAQAEQRVIEAEGIRKSQDLISKTLTPLYVQHEAIKALREGNQDKVYIPVGEQGVPLVANVNGDRVGGQ
jgi:hypothetical protein